MAENTVGGGNFWQRQWSTTKALPGRAGHAAKAFIGPLGTGTYKDLEAKDVVLLSKRKIADKDVRKAVRRHASFGPDAKFKTRIQPKRVFTRNDVNKLRLEVFGKKAGSFGAGAGAGILTYLGLDQLSKKFSEKLGFLQKRGVKATISTVVGLATMGITHRATGASRSLSNSMRLSGAFDDVLKKRAQQAANPAGGGGGS